MNKIKSICKSLGVGGQKKLAQYLKISPQAVHQWIIGEVKVPPLKVLMISKKFNIPPKIIRPDYPWEEII